MNYIVIWDAVTKVKREREENCNKTFGAPLPRIP